MAIGEFLVDVVPGLEPRCYQVDRLLSVADITATIGVFDFDGGVFRVRVISSQEDPLPPKHACEIWSLINRPPTATGLCSQSQRRRRATGVKVPRASAVARASEAPG